MENLSHSLGAALDDDEGDSTAPNPWRREELLEQDGDGYGYGDGADGHPHDGNGYGHGQDGHLHDEHGYGYGEDGNLQQHGHGYGFGHAVHGLSFEAPRPRKLESSASIRRGALSQMFAVSASADHGFVNNVCPSTARGVRGVPSRSASMPLCFFKHSLLNRGRSSSTDLDRELAWQRKKELYRLEEQQHASNVDGYDSEFNSDNDRDAESDVFYDACESDDDDEGDDSDAQSEDNGENCKNSNYGYGDATAANGIRKVNKDLVDYKKAASSSSSSAQGVKLLLRTRTKSLTDEDLEELRGSIDLGFAFSQNEASNLKSTLPALELYYAINRNLEDAKCRSSPVSPLDGNILARANSEGSTSSPSNETWRISSPGDHPSQVKTRLRHWAQAVACSVKQAF